jgi:hypothetical protein
MLELWKYTMYTPEKLTLILIGQNTMMPSPIVYANFCSPQVYPGWASTVIGTE